MKRASASLARRARLPGWVDSLSETRSDGALEPFVGGVAADVNLERGREAGEEEALGVAFAADVTADEAGDGTAAAAALGQDGSFEDFGEEVRGVDELGGSSVFEDVRLAVGQDDDFTGLDTERLAALDPNGRPALGDEVERDEVLGPGSEARRSPTCRCRLEAPGLAELGAQEDRPRESHTAQYFR